MSANFCLEKNCFTKLRSALVIFFILLRHEVEPRGFIPISLYFDRCNPLQRTPFEYKCTVPIVAGYDRYSELFHCAQCEPQLVIFAVPRSSEPLYSVPHCPLCLFTIRSTPLVCGAVNSVYVPAGTCIPASLIAVDVVN